MLAKLVKPGRRLYNGTQVAGYNSESYACWKSAGTFMFALAVFSLTEFASMGLVTAAAGGVLVLAGDVYHQCN